MLEKISELDKQGEGADSYEYLWKNSGKAHLPGGKGEEFCKKQTKG